MTSKIYLRGANPLETKELAGALGGLDGQYISVIAMAEYLGAHAPQGAFTIEGLRAFCKHTIEAVEGFLPGGDVLVDDVLTTGMTADEVVEAVSRTALWGRASHAVIPVTLFGLEAAHILSRSGTTLICNMVTSVEQVLAIADVTSGGAQESVTVILHIDALYMHGIEGISVAEAAQALCTRERALTLFLDVDSVASLVWGLEHNVAGILAPYHVLAQWLREGKPTVCTPAMSELLRSGVTISSPEHEAGLNYTYAISNSVSDAEVARAVAAWQSLLH